MDAMTLIDHLWLLLAYGGMVLHTLIKIEEERKNGTLTTPVDWIKANIISLLISIIGIPILLISLDSPAAAEILPLNNLTSIFLGYQTQSILKSFMTIAGKKVPTDANS